MEKENIECSICLKTIEPHPKDTRQAKWEEANYRGWIYGNNPDPVATGRCCDTCDCLIVLPARMGMMGAVAIEFGQMLLMSRIDHPDFEALCKKLNEQEE